MTIVPEGHITIVPASYSYRTHSIRKNTLYRRGSWKRVPGFFAHNRNPI